MGLANSKPALRALFGLTLLAGGLVACNTESDDETLRGPDEPQETIDQTQAASRGGVGGEEGGGVVDTSTPAAGDTTPIGGGAPPVPEELAGEELPDLMESHVQLASDLGEAIVSEDDESRADAEQSLAEHARAINGKLGLEGEAATQFLDEWTTHLVALGNYADGLREGDGDRVEDARSELAQFAGAAAATLEDQSGAATIDLTRELTDYVTTMMELYEAHHVEDEGQVAELREQAAERMRSLGEQLAA